jgi:hypothetical protein
MDLRADRPGSLPSTPDAIVGGAKLPRGRLIVPDPSFTSGAATDAVLWTTEKHVASLAPLWRRIAERFSEHGLWPLGLESLSGADDRPWLVGELDPAGSTSPDEYEAASVLEEEWAGGVPVAEEEPEAFEPLAPFGAEFPGLSPASEIAPDWQSLDVLEMAVGGIEGRLGLVAVARPADVPATLGWSGPVNYHSDMGRLSAVLRSSEERFGAFLVGLGFDTMTLAVQGPPRTMEHAVAIAAEHFALCSDNIHQGAGSIEEYASALVDQRVWSFWWD